MDANKATKRRLNNEVLSAVKQESIQIPKTENGTGITKTCDFNPSRKSWRIYTHKLTTLENDNLILEANGANSEIFFKQKNNEIYKLSDFLSVAKELDIIVKQQEITMQEQENTINSLIARIEKLENR